MSPQERTGTSPDFADSRRTPTPDEAYRLSYCIGADGRNMSSAERAQLLREVKWPPSRTLNQSGSIPMPTQAPRPLYQAASAPGGLEAFLKNTFPVLRPVHYKVLAGGAAVLVGIIGILLVMAISGADNSIQAGDCVTTWTNPFDDNDHIDKASCSAANAQQVLQVQGTPDGDCYMVSGADTTFQDQVTGQTYCLGSDYGAGQP